MQNNISINSYSSSFIVKSTFENNILKVKTKEGHSKCTCYYITRLRKCLDSFFVIINSVQWFPITFSLKSCDEINFWTCNNQLFFYTIIIKQKLRESEKARKCGKAHHKTNEQLYIVVFNVHRSPYVVSWLLTADVVAAFPMTSRCICLLRYFTHSKEEEIRPRWKY